jgi:ribosomal protein L19, bacterial type
MNILEKFEKEQLKSLELDKKLPQFHSGDTVKVHLRVKEGEKERIQIFEGVCIAKKNAGINSSFTVRKISYGEGIERVLPLFSPQISKIEIAKVGSVRRSKLYYLRKRSGKSARIAEKNILTQNSNSNTQNKETNPKADGFNSKEIKASQKPLNNTIESTKKVDEKK